MKQAVEKLVVKNNLLNPNKNYNALKDNLKAESISKIVVRKNDGQEIVAIDDIIAIEAQESYSCIHTISDNYLMSKNLKHFETIFEQNNSFFRSHKSWMINLNKVKSFSKTKLEIELENGIVAKLSKYKKPEFEEVMMC